MLQQTLPIFDRTRVLAQKIDSNWKRISLPTPIKARFADLWMERIRYPAETSDGQIKLYTSSSNAEYVADVSLAKAICAVPLRTALHEYRATAVSLARSASITTFEEEFEVKRNTPPPSWSEWVAAINTSGLSDIERERFRTFMCDSDAFHGIKGIARTDFAAPAIINALGHRIDRFMIADQIAYAADSQLYEAVVSFVEKRASLASQAPGKALELEVFERALTEVGFETT